MANNYPIYYLIKFIKNLKNHKNTQSKRTMYHVKNNDRSCKLKWATYNLVSLKYILSMITAVVHFNSSLPCSWSFTFN